ncbi:MAG: tyrosine-protein phosphatase [Dehalococcoidia bacterium]|nr:tyrosine-protein phosphatase [Dehalococcoidia bacterium]
MTTMNSTRELAIEVAHNVRHLGGYAAAGGRATNESVIRSASLHRLTRSGMGTLADAGVEVIVDLRSTVERERDVTPDGTPFGIRQVHAPVFEQDASPAGLGAEFNGYGPVYISMLETGTAAYRRLFETIASVDGGVVFHCAAGKDRTGVAAALLLDLAGVEEGTIVEDFSISAALLEPAFSEWLPKMAERGISEEKARGLMSSEPEYMTIFLAHLRQRHGNAEGYLRAIGVTPAQIGAVRQRLTA